MSTHMIANDFRGWIMPRQLLVRHLTTDGLFVVGWHSSKKQDDIKTDVVKDGDNWKIVLYNDSDNELFYDIHYGFTVDGNYGWWEDNLTKQIGSMHYLGFLPDIWCNPDELNWEPYMLLYNGVYPDFDNRIGYHPVGLYCGQDYEKRFNEEKDFRHYGINWGIVYKPVFENGEVKVEIIRKFEEKRD